MIDSSVFTRPTSFNMEDMNMALSYKSNSIKVKSLLASPSFIT